MKNPSSRSVLSLAAIWLLCALLALVSVALAGCTGNPNLAQQPFGFPQPGAAQNAQFAQTQELNRRLAQLNADNEDLHAKVAEYGQQLQKKQELITALQSQLNETATQLADIQTHKADTEQKLQSLQASTQIGGGARITANNSLRNSLQVVSVPGVEVRQDGDVIRIEIPADRIFVSGSSQFQQSGTQLLDQVAAVIQQNYSRQRVGIEGHTDNGSMTGVINSHHELAGEQAMAVFNQIVRTGRLTSQQLFVMAHGSNHPRFSNADAAGRARNRRIELVIYPESL